jgi:two-component system alkaline phosphatase synthesis response regulator PhoP
MSTPRKILIIDDDPDVQAILRTMLERDGYQVVAALDAMQGPMVTRKESPDLIILDIMMPAGGGAAVFQRLRQNTLTSHIPILIYSAVPSEQIRHVLPQAAAAPVLTKPVDLERLTAEVKKLLP